MNNFISIQDWQLLVTPPPESFTPEDKMIAQFVGHWQKVCVNLKRRRFYMSADELTLNTPEFWRGEFVGYMLAHRVETDV